VDLRINRLFYDTGKASYPCATKRSATSRRLARFRPTSSERRAEQWPSTPRFVDEQQSRPARLLVVRSGRLVGGSGDAGMVGERQRAGLTFASQARS
jgi:hypothetical protein